MRARAVLALSLLALTVATPVATAASAPKKVCNLVRDGKGDGVYFATPNSRPLDVVTADIATGVKNVTVIVRLDSLQSDTWTQQGAQYKVNFTAGGVNQYLRVQRSALGDNFDYGDQTGPNAGTVSLGEAFGNIDEAKGTVTMFAPKTAFKGVKGGTITAIVARSYFSTVAAYSPADEALSTAKYKDRTPSCLSSK